MAFWGPGRGWNARRPPFLAYGATWGDLGRFWATGGGIWPGGRNGLKSPEINATTTQIAGNFTGNQRVNSKN